MSHGVPTPERLLAQRLVADAVRFPSHLRLGQVPGVRIARAGSREVGIERPRSPGTGLEDEREARADHRVRWGPCSGPSDDAPGSPRI